MPAPHKGDAVMLADLVGLQPTRRVGPMINASWKPFSCSREEVSAKVEVEIPHEISLGQVVLNFVLPYMDHKSDAKTTFR
jgi:hypothetical protein